MIVALPGLYSYLFLFWLINVVLEGYKSRSIPGNRSWPPIFFLGYILVENLLSIVRFVAEDTSLACSSASMRDIESILNHDLHVLAMVGRFQSQ